MNQTWYNAERVRTPGSAVLADWLANREGGAERAGLAPSVQAAVSTGDSSQRLMDFFGGPNSAAGMAVTAISAQRVSAVYACVARIAGGISTMPLRIYQREWDEQAGAYQRRPVDDMDLWWLLNEQPCAAFTAASHWELGTQAVLLRGDGFTYLNRKNSGRIGEMQPLAWGAVQVRRRENGRLLYVVNDGLMQRTVDQDDMLHFSGLGFDGERAPSVIQHAARQAVGNALAMDEYSGRFFSGGAHPSIVLEAPSKMTEDTINALQLAFRTKYSGVANAHQIPLVLTEGIKASHVSVTAEDSQLLDARKFQVIDIARAFGVPPHMIGETSASTTWGSGLEAIGRAFVTYTLQPHLVRFEQELNRKLFRTSRYFVEFDREALQMGDSKAQAEADKAALGGPGSGPGWMSQNEVRRRRNQPPIEGGNRVYYPEPSGASAPAADPKKDEPT